MRYLYFAKMRITIFILETFVMSNNQHKKQKAAQHNEQYEKRKALELDRKNNPEKYRRKPNKEAMHHANMMLAISAGLDVRMIRKQ